MRLAVLMSLALLAAPAYAENNAVAVLDIQGTGIAPELLPTLTEILTAELAGLGKYKVIAGRDIESMLGFEKQKDVLGCTDAACLAEIGGALGVDRIVASHIGVVGSTYVVNIKLINIRMADTEGRVYETVRGEQDALIEVVKKSVAKLFGKTAGAVASTPPPANAQPTQAQPEPQHEEVAQAEPPPEAELKLKKQEKGGGIGKGPIILWVVGGVGMGAGLFFGTTAKSQEKQAEEGEVGGQVLVDKAHRNATRANLSFGLGAAAGIGGLVWFLVGGSGGETAMVPVIGPDGAGLAFSGSF